MNRKVRENYEQLARSAGLRLDPEGGALYGRRGDYDLIVTAPNGSYPYMLAVTVSAQRPGGPLTKEEGKQFRKEHKQTVIGLVQNGHVLTLSLKNTSNQAKLQEILNDGLNIFTQFLRAEGFQECCQTCGRVGEADPCFVSGGYLHLCPDCFISLQQNKTMALEQKKHKSENLIGGVVGALIGTLLGVACIIILSQLGYVAVLSGVVMAVCTLKGYELLGGKLTTKGIVISAVLMLVMTFVGDRADWAIVIARELETDFATGFRALPLLLENGMIEASSYWGNLALLYVFLLLGAIPTISSTVKNRQNEGRIYCLEKDASAL